jgi:hypothetical protein
VIWDHPHSHALSYGAEGGAWLDVSFPDTQALGLWQAPGAHFLCIEPWRAMPIPWALRAISPDHRPASRALIVWM